MTISPTATAPATAGLTREPIELVVFDMAGTTVRDDGLVEHAFGRAVEVTGVTGDLPWPEALDYVRQTMGQSKIEVFTHLAGGDRGLAEAATAAFERAYGEAVGAEGATEIDGAGDLLRELQASGIEAALTTGFAPTTRDAILQSLGWDSLVDIALAPADAGRGRPTPDLVLTAALRARVHSMARVAVVGDTTSDIEAGLRAGAGLVIGVLTGAHERPSLEAAGAHIVIDDVTALRGILLAE